jgi:hypothetical protein
MLALSFLLAAASAHAAPGLEFSDAKRLADQDEASLTPQQKEALVASQGSLLDAGAAVCATPKPDLSPFVVVVELDASGKVVRTWLQGNSPLAICFRKYVAQRSFAAPPRSSFYSSIELSFTP